VSRPGGEAARPDLTAATAPPRLLPLALSRTGALPPPTPHPTGSGNPAGRASDADLQAVRGALGRLPGLECDWDASRGGGGRVVVRCGKTLASVTLLSPAGGAAGEREGPAREALAAWEGLRVAAVLLKAWAGEAGVAGGAGGVPGWALEDLCVAAVTRASGAVTKAGALTILGDALRALAGAKRRPPPAVAAAAPSAVALAHAASCAAAALGDARRSKGAPAPDALLERRPAGPWSAFDSLLFAVARPGGRPAAAVEAAAEESLALCMGDRARSVRVVVADARAQAALSEGGAALPGGEGAPGGAPLLLLCGVRAAAPRTAFRAVDRCGDPEKLPAFQRLWGPRCELRHFPDGIEHCVVWREDDGDASVLADVARAALERVEGVVLAGALPGEPGRHPGEPPPARAPCPAPRPRRRRPRPRPPTPADQHPAAPRPQIA